MAIPSDDEIRAVLNDPNSQRKFTAQQFRQNNTIRMRKDDLGIDDIPYKGMQKITGPKSRPLDAIPDYENKYQRYQAINVYSKIQPYSSTNQNSYFEDDPAFGPNAPAQGWTYRNLDASGAPNPLARPGFAPEDLTYAPTATTDPARPRTVAAGWDPETKILTVVFRDGTYYNYFDVDNRTWENFKRSYSPGRFIKTYLDSKPRGTADVGALPEHARTALYKVTRTGQTRRQGVTGSQSVDAARRKALIKRNYYAPGNLGGTGRKRQTP